MLVNRAHSYFSGLRNLHQKRLDEGASFHLRKDGKCKESPSCYYKQIGGYRGGIVSYFILVFGFNQHLNLDLEFRRF